MNPDKGQTQIDDSDDDEKELREHSFDGIQEYDRKLPNWWLMTFYGAILFSIAYWFYYHITEVGLTPEQHLARSQQRATEAAAQGGGDVFSDERLLAMSQEATVLDSGRAAYASSCVPCHGAEAKGGIGPDLTDGEWVHGGSPTQVLHIVREGVPAKGMPGWGSILGSTKTAELTAFLLSLNPNSGDAGDASTAPDSNEARLNGDR